MKNHTVVWTNPWISIQWADLQNMVSGTSRSSLYNELLDAQAENIGRTIGYRYDFAKCQRKRKFQRMGLWTSARLQSAFLSQTLFGLKWCLNARRNFFVFWSRGWKIMLDLAGGTTVYLACGATDLRKSYHGLAAIIKLKFKLDPYSRCMFAFCNRRRTSIKILQWDGSGFWILMKRLDRDSFHWPDTPDELQKVTLKEMHWLCDGLSLTPKGAFEERHPKIVV